MVVPHPFMPTREEGRDPNVCAFPECERVWYDNSHQPSLYLAKIAPYRAAVSDALRKISQAAGVPEDLARTERASGPPRDPSADAQAATWEETPRKLYEVPADGYIPRGFAQMHGLTAASFVGSMGDAARQAAANEAAGLKKLAGVQDSEVWQVPDGVRAKDAQEALVKLGSLEAARDALVRLGIDVKRTERASAVDRERYDHVAQGDPIWSQPIDCPECDKTYVKGNLRTHLQTAHGWTGAMWEVWVTQPSINFLDLIPPSNVADYCDHPNGIGVNGCPCGAVREEEDGHVTWRNLETGEDERVVSCPECANPDTEWPISKIREHVCGEHGWAGDKYEDWAEVQGFSEFDIIPPLLKAAMEEAGPELARDVIAFMDPSVTVEDLVHVADASIESVVTEWWLKRAKEEAESVVPKAVEYGSNSLMQLGRKMAQLQGREVGDDEALELGCWANLIQKVERMTDSVMRGERCSDDTVYDIGIYIKMVQRIRDVGSWPGV